MACKKLLHKEQLFIFNELSYKVSRIFIFFILGTQSANLYVIRNFHNASESTLVNTPTMKKELISLKFTNLIEWTRGIDKEIFRPTFDKKIRDLMNPNNKEKVILYVGRISKEKNLINLCELSKKKIIITNLF